MEKKLYNRQWNLHFFICKWEQPLEIIFFFRGWEKYAIGIFAKKKKGLKWSLSVKFTRANSTCWVVMVKHNIIFAYTRHFYYLSVFSTNQVVNLWVFLLFIDVGEINYRAECCGRILFIMIESRFLMKFLRIHGSFTQSPTCFVA